MTSPIPGNPPAPIPISTDVPSIGDTNLTASQVQDAVLTNVTPNNPPAMQTLVYSPDIQILIAHGNQQFDVSSDIVAWSIRRIENGVSSAVFRLANKAVPGSKAPRYNQLFERMDRIIIKLKRVEWIQVFSGYLDSVPHVQLYPGTVNFRASCTLKRLMHTWWDPGLPQSAGIFDQAGENALEDVLNGETADAGLGSMLRRLLIEVGGWSSQDVHIQRFPIGYYTFMQQQIAKLDPGNQSAVHNFERMLLGDDTSPGTGPAAGRQLGVTRGAYSLTAPERMLEVIRAVDAAGMGPDTTDIAAAQGLGTAATGGTDQKDQEAWKATIEVGKNWSDAALKSDAAVHCFMTIAVESPAWIMYANNAVPESLTFPHEALSSNGTSVGLFQQQNLAEWGSVAQRMNPRASADMFLQHLAKYDWRNMDRGTACQNVQRSAAPAKYATMETAAVEMVRAIRSGTGTAQGAAGQTSGIPGLNLGGGVVGSMPSLNGAPGAAGLPQIPTSNGTPSVSAAGTLIGKPQYDTAGALSFAMTQIGKPYQWGATGPASYDCSGLTQAAYRSIGLEIGRRTYDQAAQNTRIPASSLVPGDLIQPDEGHTVMYAGPGLIVEAQQTGVPIKAGPIWFNMSSAACYHVPGTEYGGTPVAPFDPARAQSGGGAAPGTVASGVGGTVSTGAAEPIARNLFSYAFQAGQFTNAVSTQYGGYPGTEEKAFINDEPLIQTVISFAKAGLRNFQSAPDGSFYAYYPDYFGLDGKGAIVNVEDIEMKDVQIDLNDDALATHVYVAGAALPNGSLTGGDVGWLNSKGVATVENEWLFRRLTAAAPDVPGSKLLSGKEIMRRFGVRPLVQSMSNVQQGPMEFLLAVQIFMTKWAEQYSTQIETTFLPEVLPGMRLNLVGHRLQVYVSAVTHAGDFENGFTTSMTIMAPSNPIIQQLAATFVTATDQETLDAQNAAANASVVMGP